MKETNCKRKGTISLKRVFVSNVGFVGGHLCNINEILVSKSSHVQYVDYRT